MKFVIACDLEGIAGIVGKPNKGLGSDGRQYEFACTQAVKEINSAAKALFDNGAKEVYVWDNHGGSLNLNYSDIDKRCDIIAGVGAKHRWPGIQEKFDGFLLIGYHPNADTYAGILSHTYSSVTYQYVKINGKSVGEMEIDAAVAGEITGTPIIFVSSDEKGAKEAKKFMPWVETVSTKKGLGRNLAILKHPKKVEREIYDSVTKAVLNIGRMEVFLFESPLEVEIRYLRLENAERQYKSKDKAVEMIDPYTVKFTVDKITELY